MIRSRVRKPKWNSEAKSLRWEENANISNILRH